MGTTLIKDYETDKSENIITYKVTIGYEQEAEGIVKLNDVKIKDTQNSFDIELGKNKDLKGKKLICEQSITNIHSETDKSMTSMINEISGGPDDLNETLSEDTLAKGDVKNYYCEINFI